MRRYAVWAGSPKGTPEDPRRCIAAVGSGRSPIFYQCQNRRKADNLCGVHAKKLALYIPEDK